MLAVVLFSGWERREHEIRHAKDTVARLAESYAELQSHEVDRLKNILAKLASTREVLSMDPVACAALFQHFLSANPNYVNVALLDPEGNAVASALPFASQNLAGRKEVREALVTGAFSVGEYSVGRVSGVQILPFALPVPDAAGRPAAVLVATLRLLELGSIFDRSHLPEGSFVGVVDHNGQRLYRHPEQADRPIGGLVAQPVWRETKAAGMHALFVSTGAGGVRRIIAAQPMALGPGREPYGCIFVGLPERQLIARADAVTRRYLVWLGASLCLSAALAWVVGKYGIHARVVRLVGLAERLGAGELSARSGLAALRGSFGRLAGALDDMAAALEADAAGRQRARDRLEAEILRRKALMNQSSDGIAVIDQEHRVVEANPRFAEMLGYPPQEVIGLLTWEYEAAMAEEDIRRGFDPFANLHERFETVHRRRDGSTFDVEVSVSSVVVGNEAFFLTIVRDVTERKRHEAAVGRAREEAEAANRAKTEFLANMSHEIRTPLNGVLGMLQLLETTPLSDDQRLFLENAVTASRRLTRLLADILDISRIEAGRLLLTDAPFAFDAVPGSIEELFGREARDKGLEFVIAVAPDVPRVLVGDEARLRQILFNLVGNAVKFTEAGRVRLEVCRLPYGSPPFVRLLFMVSDTGIGIADADLGRVLEPFAQVEGSFARRFQGAGLGLSIVRRLVGLMGGALDIASETGQGTTMCLSLPLRLPDTRQARLAPAAHADTPAAAPARRILLAEDDAVSLLSGRLMLEKCGYSVTSARDGREALELFAREPFDLVLMDIQMPVMDGVAASRAMRDRERFGAKAHTPIIAMTAYAMAGDKERFLAAGMDEYIAKPVDMGALREAIERVMSRPGRPS